MGGFYRKTGSVEKWEGFGHLARNAAPGGQIGGKQARTTERGVVVFPNPIGSAAAWATNKVLVGDTTFFEIWSDGKKTFFYLTVILDVNSRRRIGWSVPFNLQGLQNFLWPSNHWRVIEK